MGTYEWNTPYLKILPLKIPSPAPPTGPHGSAQSGRTPEFGYKTKFKIPFFASYINRFLITFTSNVYKVKVMNTVYMNKLHSVVGHVSILSYCPENVGFKWKMINNHSKWLQWTEIELHCINIGTSTLFVPLILIWLFMCMSKTPKYRHKNTLIFWYFPHFKCSCTTLERFFSLLGRL